MYYDPCDYQFVLLWWKLARKEFSVRNRVNANVPLELSVDVRHSVLVCVVEEHPYQDAVEHGDYGHLGAFSSLVHR